MEIGEKYLKIKIVGHEIITAFPNKEGKDVFEYSVFGSPQQKIGDFVQTKLRGY